MIKTVRLAGYELRRFKGPLPIIGLLFLLLLPTIIGATYLWSNWDPYGRLDQVPVAVVNLDQPVQVEAETIAAGDKLVTEFKADPVFDWHFVTEEEADQGLADGDYYMIVTIPADFSANLISGEGTDPTRAVVDIRLNDANGYLADLLALSAQSRLEAAIDRAAVGAYFDSVFANLDTVKVEVTDSASSAAQLAVSATAATTQANDQSTGITTAKDSSSLIVSGLADAKTLSTQLVTSASDAKAGSASLITALTGVENNSGNLASAADDVASTSQSLASSINPAISSVNSAVQPLGQASSDLPVISSNLQTISSNLTSLAQELALTPGIDQSLVTEVIQNGADVSTAAGQTNSAANSVSAGYDSVQSASSDLSGAGSDLTSLTASSAVVASEASAVSNGVSTASSAASTVDSSIANLSTDSTSLDASIGNLQLSAQQLDDGLGVLVTGSTALAQNVSGIDTGLNLLSGQLTTTAESIPTISSQQVQDSEQVLSSPADVNVTVDNPATFYGRGLAPLLFAVAIWIFGLAVFLVLRPIAARALAGRASTARITMAAWLPILGIATLGSALLLLVTWLTLGLDPVNIGGAFGVVILGAASFTAIAHLLRTWLGVVGSAIMLVLLMVQLTSCGGLYPLETAPAPFQVISRFLPMTYLVDGLRITFTGGQTNQLWIDVAVLAGFTIVPILLTMLIVHSRRRFRLRDLHPVLV